MNLPKWNSTVRQWCSKSVKSQLSSKEWEYLLIMIKMSMNSQLSQENGTSWQYPLDKKKWKSKVTFFLIQFKKKG